MTANTDVPFLLFGTGHLITILLIAITSIAFPLIVRRTASRKVERASAAVIALALVAHELFRICMRVYVFDQPLVQHLPLHLCSLAALLLAYVLTARSYSAFEVGYFWALGGTVQALLTPDLPHGFPSLAYVTFFLGHGLVIVAVIYATVVYQFRPTLRSVTKTIRVTLAYMAVIAPLNLVLGTNYLYLRHKPEQTSLMDFFGPWPWYVLALIAAGVVSCFVYYLPFALHAWLLKRRSTPGKAGGTTSPGGG